MSELCIELCRRCQKKEPDPVVEIDIPPWQDNPIVLDCDQDTAIRNAASVAQQAAKFADRAVAAAEKRVLEMERSASVNVETAEWEVVGDINSTSRPGSV